MTDPTPSPVDRDHNRQAAVQAGIIKRYQDRPSWHPVIDDDEYWWERNYPDWGCQRMTPQEVDWFRQNEEGQ